MANDTMTAEIGGHEIAFPVKFKLGHRLTENEAAHLNALYLSRFGSNVRSDVERRSKTFTADEIAKRWADYSLGAPREGTGATVADEAAWQLAGELAKAQGKSLPRVKPKATDDEKAAVVAQKQAIIDAIKASKKDATVARLAAIVAEIKAKRAASAASSAPVAAVADLDV